MGLATRATPAAVRNAALQKEAAIRDRDAHLARMREHQKKLDSLEFRASLKTTEKKTYGSVTAHDIAAFLDVQGIPVEKSHIDLKHPIKSAGEHVVNIKLAPDIIGRLKVLVLSERE